MFKLSRGIAFGSAAILLVICWTGCGGPRMKKLDETNYRRRPAKYPIDVYVGQVPQTHRDLAVIESTAYATNDDPVLIKQKEELKREARDIGADAVEDVRVLKKEIKGYTIDERTPFNSWKQGEYPLYFLRGTAIVYESGLPGAIGPGEGFTTGPEGFNRPLGSDTEKTTVSLTRTRSNTKPLKSSQPSKGGKGSKQGGVGQPKKQKFSIF